MIQAVLCNTSRPDLPGVPIRFPIEDYADACTQLEAIGIGSATERDCCITEIEGNYSFLKRLDKVAVNVDELDYLAKRLDSYDRSELAKFQGVAVTRGYFDMTDLINLTFSCQDATVIQDFSDLNAVGRSRFLDLRGGATEDELKSTDFRKVALDLILNESGKITPYGVIYENGMLLEQLYDGRYFPEYDYDGESVMSVAMTNRHEPEKSAPITWLYFPTEDCRIERAMQRAGIDSFSEMRLRYPYSDLPLELTDLLSEGENLHDLNSLCAGYQALNGGGRQKLEAVIKMAEPTTINQAINLIAQLDLFDFAPNVLTLEDYGRFMITESGRYEYDDELDCYYDYRKYGEERAMQENGMFVPTGYVSYGR